MKYYVFVECRQKRCIREDLVPRVYLGVDLPPESLDDRGDVVPLARIQPNYPVPEGKDNLVYLSHRDDTLDDHCNLEGILLHA